MNPGAIHWIQVATNTRSFKNTVPDGVLLTRDDFEELYGFYVEHQQDMGFPVEHPDVFEYNIKATII
jgi:hypothetical protein